MSFLHQKLARLLLAASALGLLVIVGAVFATSASPQPSPRSGEGVAGEAAALSLHGHSTKEETVRLPHAPVRSTDLKWDAKTRDLTVIIVMSGFAPDSTHPVHIHLGNCNSNGPIKYNLNDVKAGNVGDGTSTTTIHNVAGGIPAT